MRRAGWGSVVLRRPGAAASAGRLFCRDGSSHLCRTSTAAVSSPLRFLLPTVVRSFHPSPIAHDSNHQETLPSVRPNHPDDLAQSILDALQETDGTPTTKQQLGARLKPLLRDCNDQTLGPALCAVSRRLGLLRTGRVLPLLVQQQDKGSPSRLAFLLLTVAQNAAEEKMKGKEGGESRRAKDVAEITDGLVASWDAGDIAKLLRVIPRSPYLSLADGKEHQSEWSPRELGQLVGHLRQDRAIKKDLEFHMDILVPLLTSLEKDGGWGREKSIDRPSSSSPSSSSPDSALSKLPSRMNAFDLDYVPKVVGPALGPFFSYWGNQDYATVVHCLITAFSQHAVAAYGQHSLTKSEHIDFCVEMMAQTAIASKPTVGMLHYIVNDLTEGWDESDTDELTGRLDKRMKPHSFFRRWFRKMFNMPTPP